jgi:hypothetical protein
MTEENKSVPTEYRWNPEDDIVIKGYEFSHIINFFKLFEPGVTITNRIFQRMIEQGKATAVTPKVEEVKVEEVPVTNGTDVTGPQ